MQEALRRHVTLEHLHDFEFSVRFDDGEVEHRLQVDERPPLGHDRGPNPAALLTAAVANCLAASLVYCLKKTHGGIEGVDAAAEAHIVRNEAGRLRISHIDVSLTPKDGRATIEDLDKLDRCEDLFEDFCIVTQSIRQGIPVNVHVDVPAVAAA